MTHRYIMIFLAVCMFAAVQAQDDFRAQAPEPGPPRKVVIGEYHTDELSNGLKVIVVENHKLPRISYQLFIDRDPLVEGDKAGLTSITGELLNAGTTTKSKAEIDEAVEFVGGSLSTSSRGGFASSLTRHTDVILDLLADVILNPSFPEDEFQKIKTQQISALQFGKDDPGTIAGVVSAAVNYGLDHPYGEVMTENTVENVTVEDCKEYYGKFFTPRNAYVVVVGDITPEDAVEKVSAHFGDWQGEPLEEMTYETPATPEATRVAFVDKAGAVQSVIRITYPVELRPGDEDIIPARVMNQVLGSGSSGRLFKNLREDKGYTYGAYSSLSNDELIGSFTASASVRNEVTDSAVSEFLYELERIGKESVTEDELSLAKNSIAGSFARSLESPQTVGNFALSTIRFDLPEDYYATYLERLDKVNIEDVQAMAEKYVTPGKANIVVVGAKGEVSDKLEQFDKEDGKVTFYDIYGSEKEPAMDAGDITGEQIIQAYIDAVGGAAAIESVESLKQEMVAEAMGQELNINEYRMSGKVAVVMSMSGQTIVRQVFDGEKAYTEQMGQRQELQGEMLEDMKESAMIVPELRYLNGDYQLDVDGIEAVNGEMAYKVNVNDSDGLAGTHFFSKDSGLKLKSVTSAEMNGQTQTTTVEFSEYKEVSGLVIPHVQVVSGLMPVPLEMKTRNVEVNASIDPTVFQ